MSATVVVCSFLTGEMSVRYSLGNASSFLWEVQAEAGLGVHERVLGVGRNIKTKTKVF